MSNLSLEDRIISLESKIESLEKEVAALKVEVSEQPKHTVRISNIRGLRPDEMLEETISQLDSLKVEEFFPLKLLKHIDTQENTLNRF